MFHLVARRLPHKLGASRAGRRSGTRCGVVLGLALALTSATAFGAPFNGAERATLGAALGLGDAVFGLDDATLGDRVLAWARTEAGQRLRPAHVDPLWTLEPALRDLPAELTAARGAGRLGAWLSSLAPAAPAYRALSEARGRYAMTVEAGGWPTVPQGPSLRIGDRGEAVLILRARLAAEGYGATAADLAAFDAALEAALRDFQALHALDVDGVLGPATRTELNITAAERLGQIDANLERWRWMPANMPDERVEVDTGAQEATLYRNGAPVLSMRAIVGSPKHPTPMFASHLDAVIVNPPWNVPASIALTELLPAEARRPGLLASMGIRRVNGGLQQRPGPNNSLGLVKFDLPSRFGVYLHDTPGKGLFAQPVRAFSHGCMRLQKPRDLALAVLAPEGVDVTAFDAATAAGATRRFALRRKVPFYVVHWTVRAEPGGRLGFRRDIYGWDRALIAALPKARVAQGQGARAAIPQARRHV